MKISIITATYNAADQLPGLIKSLREQSDQDFEWVIADGGSTDGTLTVLKSIKDLNVIISSQEDFGVYDALNRGIKISTGEYYLVLGADDRLCPSAIKEFKRASLTTNIRPDFIASGWESNSGVSYPLCNKGWLYGMRGIASCHSVALLIRKNLHLKFGYYSNRFPVCADQLFVKRAIYGGAVVSRKKFISGYYSSEGMSGTQTLAFLTDFLKVQVVTEKSKLLQILIFLIRLVKNFRFI